MRNEELFWGIEGANSDFKFFEVSQVVKATSNFSGQNKLGQGGFGPVYKVKIKKTIMVLEKIHGTSR